MATKLNLSAVNKIEKGTVVYAENDLVESICLVLKGRVLLYNNGIKMAIGTGSFMGVTDVGIGRYISNYVAYDNLMVFAFPVSGQEDVEKILNVNKDYPGLIISYLNRGIAEIYKTNQALNTCAENIYSFIMEKEKFYTDMCKKSGHIPTIVREMANIVPFTASVSVEEEKINYYGECYKIPIDLQKSYYSYSAKMAMYHVKEQADIVQALNMQSKELAVYICQYFVSLINDETDCLFKCISKLAVEISQQGGRNEELISAVDDIVAIINDIEDMVTSKTGTKISVNREIMEEIYYLLLTGDNNQEISSEMQMKYTENDAAKAVSELNNSMGQILDYSECLPERKEEITKFIIDFNNLKDKATSDDHARLLRRKISEAFYELYEILFIKSYSDNAVPRAVELFLEYGFLDENLLTKDQIIELYYLNDEKSGDNVCNVYTMKNWIYEIYEGRKDPSKNEFDLDYMENLREIKKTKKLSKDEEDDYLNNPKRRIHYEIKNMFRYNNRLVNGQVALFVPILYSDLFNNSVQKQLVTTDIINKAIKELLDIDYSAFYREVLYYDESIGIKKEYIQKQVFPDIILMPTCGVNSVMWQEIAGKKRDTSGRFLFPVFNAGDLYDMVVKVTGRFRWELCRTIQGPAWNNISEKSLTSEYVDYIQFYRKNRELSEEKKEKLKLQIQKGKNNSREIFLIDYVTWIKNEFQGAIRLNKPVREIVATYCPFTKVIRDRIASQPIFDEAMARFNREHIKRSKELDLRFRALQKDKIDIPEEMIITQKFYTEM